MFCPHGVFLARRQERLVGGCAPSPSHSCLAVRWSVVPRGRAGTRRGQGGVWRAALVSGSCRAQTHLAMQSTVQMGVGRPFGGEHDEAPCACSEHLFGECQEHLRYPAPVRAGDEPAFGGLRPSRSTLRNRMLGVLRGANRPGIKPSRYRVSAQGIWEPRPNNREVPSFSRGQCHNHRLSRAPLSARLGASRDM